MAASSQIGLIRLTIDGEWDIADLRGLSESLSDSYGLFYPLIAQEEEVRTRLQDQLRQHFWSGDIDTRYLGRHLYRSIPKDESLKLKSFKYASAGSLELVGILPVLWMLARVARAWIKTGDEFLEFWKKVEQFFDKRKHLRRPKKQFTLDAEMATSSDEARTLVLEVGDRLGFDAISCERLIEIVGNPISALKYLVAAGREGRNLAELHRAGLLELPTPTDEAISILGTRHRTRRTQSGVEVQVVTRRRKPRTPST